MWCSSTGPWGLGEVIVQGRVNPDEFWVHKPTARERLRSIIRKEAGDKRVKLVYAEGRRRQEVREISVPERDRERFVLDRRRKSCKPGPLGDGGRGPLFAPRRA